MTIGVDYPESTPIVDIPVNAISPASDLSRHGCNMIFLSFLLLLYEFCIFVYMVFITCLAVALDWVPHWYDVFVFAKNALT